MNTWVVIPAYNEERHIGRTLDDVRSQPERYHVVVVDDGSTDRTYDSARAKARVLRHRLNRGMGAALVTGTRYALRQGAECVVHFDADGQHHASEIRRVIDKIEAGSYDVVLGSRYLEQHQIPFTKKYFIHWPARIFQNVMTGVRLTDVHNGFRAMSRSAAEKIRIEQDRMAHNSEIVAQLRVHHLRFCEVPVTITYSEYGQKLSDGVKIIRDLIIKKLLK